jgi:poly(A) polymerase
MMRVVAERLSMDEVRAQRIAFIIERHGWVNAYSPRWSDRAVRRLMSQAGARLDDLLAFSSADYTTRRRQRKQRIAATLEHLRARIDRLREEDSQIVSFPRGFGVQLAQALDLQPGPALGLQIESLRARVRSGEIPRDLDPEALIALAIASKSEQESAG